MTGCRQVGQAGAPPVPTAVADHYTLELQALAASLATPADNERRPY
ncbi:MAG TPA: hypothetical protein VG411_09505 [Actinomycetota bacterium]|nr:hypothetical protein [Actinomycetota bacterium]